MVRSVRYSTPPHGPVQHIYRTVHSISLQYVPSILFDSVHFSLTPCVAIPLLCQGSREIRPTARSGSGFNEPGLMCAVTHDRQDPRQRRRDKHNRTDHKSNMWTTIRHCFHSWPPQSLATTKYIIISAWLESDIDFHGGSCRWCVLQKFAVAQSGIEQVRAQSTESHNPVAWHGIPFSVCVVHSLVLVFQAVFDECMF